MCGKKSRMTSDLVCDEWEIPIDNLVIKEKLNEGVFGKVYYGHVKGPTTNQKVHSSIRNNLCIPVAIKMLKGMSHSTAHILIGLYMILFLINVMTYISVKKYSHWKISFCSKIQSYYILFAVIFIITDGSSGKDKRDFLNEMDIMKTISQFGSSPHVVMLIGCITVQEPVVLATSFIKHGDLWKYLQHIRKNVITKKSL